MMPSGQGNAVQRVRRHGQTARRVGGLRQKASPMKQSDLHRQKAESCMQVAEAALGEHACGRYQRMEAAWLTLAEQQQWPDGERSPIDALEKVTGK